jgi:hypothetical protein
MVIKHQHSTYIDNQDDWINLASWLGRRREMVERYGSVERETPRSEVDNDNNFVVGGSVGMSCHVLLSMNL